MEIVGGRDRDDVIVMKNCGNCSFLLRIYLKGQLREQWLLKKQETQTLDNRAQNRRDFLLSVSPTKRFGQTCVLFKPLVRARYGWKITWKKTHKIKMISVLFMLLGGKKAFNIVSVFVAFLVEFDSIMIANYVSENTFGKRWLRPKK